MTLDDMAFEDRIDDAMKEYDEQIARESARLQKELGLDEERATMLALGVSGFKREMNRYSPRTTAKLADVYLLANKIRERWRARNTDPDSWLECEVIPQYPTSAAYIHIRYDGLGMTAEKSSVLHDILSTAEQIDPSVSVTAGVETDEIGTIDIIIKNCVEWEEK